MEPVRGIEEDPSGCPPVGKGWDNEPTDESETATQRRTETITTTSACCHIEITHLSHWKSKIHRITD